MTARLVGGVMSMLLTLGSSVSTAQDRKSRGKVVQVQAGDRVTIQVGGTQVKLGINGVDCPVSGQPFARQARRFASRLLLGKTVSIVMNSGYMSSGEADIRLGAKLVSVELVRSGLCWWHRQELCFAAKLAKLEARARRARRGLWAGKHPVPPWDWRRGVRGTRAELGAPPTLPPAKERRCHDTDDCTEWEVTACRCAPCGWAWRTPMNRQTYNARMRRRRRCRPDICPGWCKVKWVGRARCVEGQCQVRP